MNQLRAPGLLLGFALGGFFDGVLLHQILQWHHLLSLVEGVRDQVLFDGLFHAAMYLVAIVGIVLLVRRRGALAEEKESSTLLAFALIGFGAWHLTDALLSHWVLGIHRIRVDSPQPILWDLGWLFVFGLLPLALGLTFRQRSRPIPTAPLLVLLTLGSGGWAAAPAVGESEDTLIIFRPGLSAAQEMNAILAAGAAPIAQTPGLWLVRLSTDGRVAPLYAGGALLVGGSALGGCLSWSRT